MRRPAFVSSEPKEDRTTNAKGGTVLEDAAAGDQEDAVLEEEVPPDGAALAVVGAVRGVEIVREDAAAKKAALQVARASADSEGLC